MVYSAVCIIYYALTDQLILEYLEKQPQRYYEKECYTYYHYNIPSAPYILSLYVFQYLCLILFSNSAMICLLSTLSPLFVFSLPLPFVP